MSLIQRDRWDLLQHFNAPKSGAPQKICCFAGASHISDFPFGATLSRLAS
jgi:hypothetical protein